MALGEWTRKQSNESVPWRKQRKAKDVAAFENTMAFVAISGAAGYQMRLVHAVKDGLVRRAAGKILLAPWGGAVGPCFDCGAMVRLNAKQLQACGGRQFIAAMHMGD